MESILQGLQSNQVITKTEKLKELLEKLDNLRFVNNAPV